MSLCLSVYLPVCLSVSVCLTVSQCVCLYILIGEVFLKGKFVEIDRKRTKEEMDVEFKEREA